MADYFCEFVAIVTDLTDTEAAWMRDKLEDVCLFGDGSVYPTATLPDGLSRHEAAWQGPHLLLDFEDYELFSGGVRMYAPGDGSEYSEDYGRCVVFESDDSCDPAGVAWIVQQFLKACRPNDCWGFEYALSCSKMQLGGFGGGCFFVTAEAITQLASNETLANCRRAFASQKSVRG